MNRGAVRILLDALLVALLTVALIWPLFKLKYSANWASIESTFIGEARFLSENWPHPGWNPLWYCGTRFDYTYPPALRYGTALLTEAFPIIPARAYHLYVALFYCLGIAGVYLLARIGSGSRGWAWIAAAAVAVFSPCVMLLENYREDSALQMPQRLNVLLKWGEGPHMSSLAMATFALAAGFLYLRNGRRRDLALTALFSALAVSNNFYGATTLATLFPLAAWSVWVTHRENRVWTRTAAVAVLAYGLTAFWLSPSYLRITGENLKLVSLPGNAWSAWAAAVTIGAFLLVTWRWAGGRKQADYAIFLAGSLLVFGLNVLGNQFYGFRVVGEPTRLVPELDLVLLLCGAEILRRMTSVSVMRNWGRAVVAVLVLVLASLGFGARRYLAEPWSVFKPDLGFQDRIEYRLTDWVNRRLPGSRVFASGSVRFWYSAWNNLAQVDGGSEQGLLNIATSVARAQVLEGNAPERDLQWLLALGADAVIVHDERSQEEYRDWAVPKKFAGRLPVLYDDDAGNVIYKVPRRFPGLARVVETRRLEALAPIPHTDGNLAELKAYASVLEEGPDSPAVTDWKSPDELLVNATVGAEQSVLVQVNYDPAWRARATGRELTIRKDVMGFMRIDAPPGEHEIQLTFETPLENHIGRIVSLSSLLLAGWLLRRQN